MIRVGHGRTPWHCACHEAEHAVPSLAWLCEQRHAALLPVVADSG